MLEFEANERKVNVVLEYQRRMEDEAKQKHLAEKKKKKKKKASERLHSIAGC